MTGIVIGGYAFVALVFAVGYYVTDFDGDPGESAVFGLFCGIFWPVVLVFGCVLGLIVGLGNVVKKACQ